MMIVLQQYKITFKIDDGMGDGQVSTVRLQAHQENIEKVLQCLLQSGVHHIEIDYYDPNRGYQSSTSVKTAGQFQDAMEKTNIDPPRLKDDGLIRKGGSDERGALR